MNDKEVLRVRASSDVLWLVLPCDNVVEATQKLVLDPHLPKDGAVSFVLLNHFLGDEFGDLDTDRFVSASSNAVQATSSSFLNLSGQS